MPFSSLPATLSFPLFTRPPSLTTFQSPLHPYPSSHAQSGPPPSLPHPTPLPPSPLHHPSPLQGLPLHTVAGSAFYMAPEAAAELDAHGNKEARIAITMVKVAAPRAAQKVLDRAIQVHGGGGVSSDFPLARLWTAARTLRIADGPDEVHLASIGKKELRDWQRRMMRAGSSGSSGKGGEASARL
ncbi:unnamed protein product [Closterium sp. Naga37s-1]|nr:unnamed protein product [Closterium sp. Naga37s-1]